MRLEESWSLVIDLLFSSSLFSPFLIICQVITVSVCATFTLLNSHEEHVIIIIRSRISLLMLASQWPTHRHGLASLSQVCTILPCMHH